MFWTSSKFRLQNFEVRKFWTPKIEDSGIRSRFMSFIDLFRSDPNSDKVFLVSRGIHRQNYFCGRFVVRPPYWFENCNFNTSLWGKFSIFVLSLSRSGPNSDQVFAVPMFIHVPKETRFRFTVWPLSRFKNCIFNREKFRFSSVYKSNGKSLKLAIFESRKFLLSNPSFKTW